MFNFLKKQEHPPKTLEAKLGETKGMFGDIKKFLKDRGENLSNLSAKTKMMLVIGAASLLSLMPKESEAQNLMLPPVLTNIGFGAGAPGQAYPQQNVSVQQVIAPLSAKDNLKVGTAVNLTNAAKVFIVGETNTLGNYVVDKVIEKITEKEIKKQQQQQQH